MDRDQVLAEIRKRKIKLWLEPYLIDGTNPSRASLETLAATFFEEGEGTTTTSSTTIQSQGYIADILQDLQNHALEKLRNKPCLQIKIAGLKSDEEHLNSIKFENNNNLWASLVERSYQKGKHSALLTLKMYQVRRDLSVENFLSELQGHLPKDVHSLRLVHRGKVVDSLKAWIVSIFNPPTIVLCLVSYLPQAKVSLIDSLRRAAGRLSRDFDVTDQSGNNVSMTPIERKSFLTALGLHRLGRQKSKHPSESLPYLLQADNEWNINIATQWRITVDNYGLLQLDISWTYLLLESMDNLTDAMQRLEIAERVLKKQVNSNFCTLALVQAEMGNPVPPLSAVFCRLFLLQGAAYRYVGNVEKSRERLDWAYALCCSLRNVCEGAQVKRLVEALTAEEFHVISALRRTNGNIDQAAALIQEDAEQEAMKAETRNKQHHLGLCQNKTDYVDLDMVGQVQTVLGLMCTSSLADLDYQVSTGLLRLANNDMQKCIDIYQDVEQNAEGVSRRVRDLDRELEWQGLGKKPRNLPIHFKVDEIALATLISMGIDKPTAERALKQADNNVERATSWLTSHQPNDDSHNGESSLPSAITNNGSIPNVASLVHTVATMVSNAGRDSKRARIDKEEMEAEMMAEAQLKASLQDHDLEKDYLGSKLDEEWAFLHKFREEESTNS